MKFLGVISEDVTGLALTVIALVIAWGWKEYIFQALDQKWGIKTHSLRLFVAMVIITVIGICAVKLIHDSTHSCHFANTNINTSEVGPDVKPPPASISDE